MYRLQYRNFGGHQSMVVNHTVDAGSNHAGIRWYEMRDNGGGWGIHQQGTYAPDSDHRWMGSIAMNGAGDIAMGYSVSSNSTYPSIRFTGRLAEDTLGQMTQGEGEIIAGSGYQTHSSGRWGDYSMMSVDPVDDCTFWYTQEYYAVVGVAPWQTHIGSFKLAECGPVDNPPSVTITNPAELDMVSGDSVLINADVTDDDGVNSVTYRVDGGSEQPMSLASGTDTNGTWSATWNSETATEGTQSITVTANDGVPQTSTDSVNVIVNNINDPPVADFSYTASALTVNFSDQSSDSDGSIVAWSWDIGDGNTSTAQNPSHTYDAGETYTVWLTVTDNDGATDSTSQDVTVSSGGGISLSVTGYKVRGLQKANLEWSGTTGAEVKIYRDSVLIATTANDGFYTDPIDARGGGSYTYQVCESDDLVCSNEATVNF
jgi:PKD repeat protein